MHFEVAHEFDMTLDVLELAFLSPELGPRLARVLAPGIESVETLVHRVENGEMTRTLRFQASAPIPVFKGFTIGRDALCWETRIIYRMAARTATWEVLPREQYRRYFRASGTYLFEAMPDGRSRRSVAGDLEIPVRVPFVGSLVERGALAEVRKSYDVEADTLRELATL